MKLRYSRIVFLQARYGTMFKFIALTIISLCSGVALANDIFVPEPVLNSWGYRINENLGDTLHIKGVEGEDWGEKGMYYPDFRLTRSCFTTDEEASTEQNIILERHKNDPFKGGKSHYDSFVYGSCLYSITTHSRHTYLSYQPAVLKNYKEYVYSAVEP